MKRIYDKELVNQYIKKYNINSLFESKNLPFYLMQYEKDEKIIVPLEHTKYLLFIVEGTISIYSIRQDGSQYSISCSNDFTLLGDVEFINKDYPLFFAEAKSQVTALCLSIEDNKAILEKDTIFLHYLLKSLVKKLKLSADNDAKFISLEEKLIHYIKYSCPNETLMHIEKASLNLHCSRRQLQRILKKLVDEKIIIRLKKGVYKLNDESRN